MWMAICATMAGVPFTSCSDSETDSLDVTESTDVTEVTKVALSISAGKQNGSGSDARKADYDAEDFESGDELGLYVLSADDLQSAYIDEETCYNVRATYDGSSWTLDSDIFLTNGDAYVIAYYPYDSSIGHTLSTSDDGTLLFDLTPSGSEQTDVLASEGVTVNSSSPKANLSFSHVLTRITLIFEVADDLTTSGSLKSMIISADELYSDAGLYIDAYGSFQTYSQSTTSSMTLSLSETLTAGDETSVDFLIPSESSTTLTIEFTVNSTSYSFELSTNDDEEWAAGYQYEYDITLTTDENYGDETEEINGYTAVDLGLSVRWAEMNVGATSEEEYGNYYAWGEISEPSDGNYSTGNCTLYNDSSVSDISGNASYDAATANWGSPWRMPTYEEWLELLYFDVEIYNEDVLGSKYYYDTYHTEGATMTYDDTTYANDDIVGLWFNSPNGNSIFLPIAGYKNGTSDTYFGGSSTGYLLGYYWVSEQYSATSAWFVYIYWYSTYSYYYPWENTFPKSRGMPVRPVCDYDD